jgi:hypothetical protein
VLVLYSDLRAFLEALAHRGAGGRVLAREIFRGFSAAIPLDVNFSVEEQLMLTDLQIAAYGWLMQTTFLASIVRHQGRGRVRTLNANSLLADPVAALAAMGNFFGLDVSPQRWSEIAAGPVFKEHAKQPGVSFNADSYHAQHNAAGTTYGEEIGMVEAWAAQLAQRGNATFRLGDSLLT